MKKVAIILTLLIAKAGVALPITYAQLIDIQSNVQDDESSCEEDLNLCDNRQNSSDDCCGSGSCCCVAIGGFMMTFLDLDLLTIFEDLYHNSSFSYSSLYRHGFHGAVFEPPKVM